MDKRGFIFLAVAGGLALTFILIRMKKRKDAAMAAAVNMPPAELEQRLGEEEWQAAQDSALSGDAEELARIIRRNFQSVLG